MGPTRQLTPAISHLPCRSSPKIPMTIHLQSLAAALLLAAAAAAAPLGDVAHDMLQKYGLPIGLLPDTVKSYSLSGNGDFEVELAAPCYHQFSSLVYYERIIKGKLSYGAITNLSGIQAKKLFLWVSVTGIVSRPSKSSIEFEVGFLSELLPASQFDEIPKCKAKAACRGAAGIVSDLLPVAEV